MMLQHHNHGLLHAISTSRRRLAVILVDEIDHDIDIGTLADLITEIYVGKQWTGEDRKKHYIGLYQTDSKQLKQAGVIDIDERRSVYEPTKLTPMAASIAVSAMEIEEPTKLTRLYDVLANHGYQVDDLELPFKPELFRIPTGRQIERLRKDIGMTQQELADAAGCSAASISNYETGRHSIRSDAMQNILTVLRNQHRG